MPQVLSESLRVIDHKKMRAAVGAIALLMPVAVVYLSGKPELDSISASYWTDSRDIFVGSLIAVGFFLFAYNGTGTCGRDLEFALSKVACVFSIGIALFPTAQIIDSKEIESGAVWVSQVSSFFGKVPSDLHIFFAISLFVCLFFFMLFFSQRAKRKGKLMRSRFYMFISLAMAIGMPAVYLIGERYKFYSPIYGIEVTGLVLFGIGWLAAGLYRTEPPLAERELSAGLEFITTVQVDPKELNFPTSIQVSPGEKYTFTAEGCWRDWFINCGPNGWGPDWNPLAFKNRVKWQSFFLLCGNVGKDDRFAFVIGDSASWVVPDEVGQMQDRSLYFFANDWPSMYSNNQGISMQVSVYRHVVGGKS